VLAHGVAEFFGVGALVFEPAGEEESISLAAQTVQPDFYRVKWTAPLLCVGVLIAGCAVLPREVTFVRGNIRCEGLQDDLFSATKYSTVWVGTAREPYSGSPRLTLRFPDGVAVRTDQLEVNWLRARADQSTPRRASSLLAEQGWAAGSEELSVAGYRFVVQGDKVLSFGIGFDPLHQQLRPEFGDADGKVFHRPPFREGDLVALIGPPDNVRKRIAGGLP